VFQIYIVIAHMVGSRYIVITHSTGYVSMYLHLLLLLDVELSNKQFFFTKRSVLDI
jgi:hypothetical protein